MAYWYGEDTNRLEYASTPEPFRSMTFSWDVAGRLEASSDGVSYRYDATRKRVEKIEPGPDDGVPPRPGGAGHRRDLGGRHVLPAHRAPNEMELTPRTKSEESLVFREEGAR